MTNMTNVTAKGASGTTYSLSIHPLGTAFKALGGIYIVIAETVGELSALYVGQTGNLSERFDNHHKARSWQQRSANRIAILLESAESKRLGIESDLIAGLNPPCNG
jgi:hypothetical protein